MIAAYLSKKLIAWKVPFLLQWGIKILARKKNILQKSYKDFSFYENKEGNTEFNISRDAFDSSKRKNGIALFARLKNSQDFLEISIESFLPLVDEIILVDNNSSDGTPEICKKMQSKYSEKIKFFMYTPDVATYGHPDWNTIPNDSIQSMAYYYNWTLSKTSYKYVAKLDDDLIAFDQNFLKEIFQNIRKNGLKRLEIFPQFNISYGEMNSFQIPIQGSSKILPFFGWLYLDHGVFPISPQTYFIRDISCESFIFPFWVHVNKACIFHLKGLKKNAWTSQYLWKVKDDAYKLMTQWEFIQLPKVYETELLKWLG